MGTPSLWDIEFTNDAKDDLRKLDNSLQKRVMSAIHKASRMLSESGGRFGKPLGNQGGVDLAGCYKIRVSNLRIVYKVEIIEERMVIVIIGARADKAVYWEAARRLRRSR